MCATLKSYNIRKRPGDEAIDTVHNCCKICVSIAHSYPGNFPLGSHERYPSLATCTQLPPPLLFKVKQNISDSNPISHRQRTLPSNTKQTSDSHPINLHHGIHRQTCMRELSLPLQRTSFQPVINSPPFPLPPKPVYSCRNFST